ncbi:Fic family protein [Bradyrhizobium brasilense]|uniref:Fic family protein n=1 Tax=Bradyrhizobium brasilense TaxID=1419277 RepID=UPI001E5E2EC7|nr:Fic family protein [Bradyrhizobium brasilense]
MPPDEIAVRLHHRLTQIHAFTNGNARQARMMADLLVENLGSEPFTWGSSIHAAHHLYQRAYPILRFENFRNETQGPVTTRTRPKHYGWGREGEGMSAEEPAFVLGRFVSWAGFWQWRLLGGSACLPAADYDMPLV